MNVEERRGTGRPNKTCGVVIREDHKLMGLSRDAAKDCTISRTAI